MRARIRFSPLRPGQTGVACPSLCFMRIHILILACFATALSAEVRYKVIALDSGEPSHLSGWPFAINNHGDVVGESYAMSAFRFSDAKGFEDLGQAAAGGNYTVAMGINDNEIISAIGNTVPYGYLGLFVYTASGGFAQVPLPPGADMYSTSINNRGQHAGTYSVSNGDNVSFVYTPGQGFEEIVSLGGEDSTTFAINDLGWVTGFVADGQAFLFKPESGMNDIGAGVGWAVNNQGVVAGGTGMYGPSTGGVFANGRVFVIGGGKAEGINNRDVVVGDGAYVWTASEGMDDLNSLIDTNSGWALWEAVAVNDAGQITGNGLFEGAACAFRLDPIPPTLSLNPAGTNLLVSWSPAWQDVMLQQNDNLTTTNWTDLPNASVSPITLPATATQGFYRLRRLTNDEMHQQFLQWLSSQP